MGGYIGLYPTGGAAWDYVQYPVGLMLLGHDVYYIEDTRQYPLYQQNSEAWDDASGCVSHLKGIMEKFGMKDRWAYRDVASGQSFGMSEEKILELCRSADIFVNVSCSTYPRDEYLKIPKRILIDSDPMFTQMQYSLQESATKESKDWTAVQILESHTHLFTFGKNIGAENCRIPLLNFKWIPTHQPVCLEFWQGGLTKAKKAFTSVMNWSDRKKFLYGNEEWGQKDVEFEKIKKAPTLLPSVNFEVVMNKPISDSLSELGMLGWSIREPWQTVASPDDYKSFIFGSAAEFSVAKETYVKSNSGWFSCRSACYLAAGKPVITQDTQWSKYLPTGAGLFAFSDLHSAVDSVNMVNSSLEYHSRKAKEIAHEYFDSNIVLTKMLDQLN